MVVKQTGHLKWKQCISTVMMFAENLYLIVF